MRKLLLLTLLLIGSKAIAQVPCRAIAPGASGTGLSWSSPQAIPSGTTWTRGTRYYIADGNYGNTLTMTTPISGTSVIELRKAQSYDFGRTSDGCTNDISAGWNASTMGSAQAVFATSSGGTTTLFNLAGYTTINGNGAGVSNDPVGCGGMYATPTATNVVPPPIPAGCGIKFDNSGCTTSVNQGCGNDGSGVNGGSANHVTFEYTEQFGNGGRGTSLSNVGGTVNNENYWWFPSTTSLTGTVVTHNYFHNNMTTYMIINGSGSFISWDHNYAWGMYDSSSLHSEAIQIQGTNHDLTVADNIFRDQATNGDVVVIGATGGNLNNLFFYNNLDFCTNGTSSNDVLYGTTCNHTQGMLGCINTGAVCSNFFVYNNTMAQVGGGTPGPSGGVFLCGTANATGGTVTNFNFENNLFYNCGAFHANQGSSGTWDYNAYLNSGQAAVGAHDTSSSSSPNPFVALNATTPNLAIANENALWTGRTSLGSPYDTDILGLARTTDRGAYQFPGLPIPDTSYIPGQYNGSITNIIYNNTPGATICYRTDGGIPTAATPGTCDAPALSSTVSPDGNNQAQVTISATTTITAIATQAGAVNSQVFTGLYTIAVGCTLPTISGVTTSSDPTGTQLTVNWSTSPVATDAQLVYGLGNGTSGIYTNPLIFDTSGTTSHSITVTGLVPGHVYYYLINSRAITAGPTRCGSGYATDLQSNASTTAVPAGTFNYSIVPTGPTYITQGNGIYVGLNLYALQGTYTGLSLNLTITGAPTGITYGWTDSQVLGGADTPSPPPIYNILKVYNFGPKELNILAGATTPLGTYTLTITGSAVSGCSTNCPPTVVATWPIHVVPSSAPFSGTVLSAATPSSYPALPTGVVAQYKANANLYGGENCGQDIQPKPRATPIRANDNTNIIGNLIGFNSDLSSWYYDGLLGNIRLGNLLQGDPTYGGQNWAQCVENQKNWYGRHFAIPEAAPGLGIQIITSFTKGSYDDYAITADPLDFNEIQAIVNNGGVYTPAGGGLTNVNPYERETAYSLRNLTHTVALGITTPIAQIGHQTPAFLLPTYLDRALGDLDQVCLSQNADWFQPFFVGLTSEWLIEYNDLATKTGLWPQDPRIPPAIACAAQYIYTNYWQHNFPSAFDLNTLVRNINRNQLDGAGGGSCIADTSGLIVPMFGYLFQYTGNPVWQQEGDEIFYSMTWLRNCGTNGIGNGSTDLMRWPPGSGVNNGGKTFNTIYQWAPNYITWRSAPAFSVTPGSAGFFNVPTTGSATDVITLSNPTATPVVVPNGGITITGTNALSFTQGNGTCGATPITIAARGSCNITVTIGVGGIPLSSYNATLTVTPTGLSALPVTLYGTATTALAAQPTITPGSGTYAAGSSFTIASTTPGSSLCVMYDANDPTPANHGFTVSVPSGEITLADGGGCNTGTLMANPATINLTTVGSGRYIRATATKAGIANSPEAMTVNTINPSGTITVSLTPSSITNFSTNQNTNSVSQAVTLSNTGTSAVIVSTVVMTGAFTQTNVCGGTSFTLAVGASCVFNIVFSPNATGTFNGAITISDNATGSPHITTLQGLGTAPVISITNAVQPTPPYNFGAVNDGQTVFSSVFTLTNSGNGPLNVVLTIGGTNAPQFGQTNNCPTILIALANCSITASFSPTLVQSYSATLVETDPVQSLTGSFALSGTGLAAIPVTVAPLPWVLVKK